MTTPPTLEERITILEARLNDLHDHVVKPPKPHWLKRVFSWDTAKNLMFVVGVPAGLVGLYALIDEQFVRAGEIAAEARLATAVEHLAELQDYNAQVFERQARRDDDAAFALEDAKRGRVERLAKDLYAFWQTDPNVLTRSEMTTLAEALLSIERNDRALAVIASVDQSQMPPRWQGDMDILKARALFARGPAQDADAARAAYRDAMAHTDEIDAVGLSFGLIEKFVAVRLSNELWLGTPCEDLDVFASHLWDVQADGITMDIADPIRRHTLNVLAAHDHRCGAS